MVPLAPSRPPLMQVLKKIISLHFLEVKDKWKTKKKTNYSNYGNA
jgi:hypothetical protein